MNDNNLSQYSIGSTYLINLILKITEEQNDEHSSTLIFNEKDYNKAEKILTKALNHNKQNNLDLSSNNHSILLPINIDNNHWVLVEANLKEREFNIYDTIKSISCDNSSLKDILKKLQKFFEEYLRRKEKEKKSPVKKVSFTRMNLRKKSKNLDESAVALTPIKTIKIIEWEINYKDCPQQSNSSDCGVLMLKFIENLIDKENKTVFHVNMAYTLFYRHEIGLRLLAKIANLEEVI